MIMEWTVTLFLFGRVEGFGAPLIIDDFAYTNTAAARSPLPRLGPGLSQAGRGAGEAGEAADRA